MSPVFKVAIIGGGPAGCPLARLFLNAQIPVTIFEYEISPNVRTQGGILDLHPATGLKALKTAGLYDEFVKCAALMAIRRGQAGEGCKLRSIDSELSLHFDHGIEKGYDLIVGADGAWSKLRPYLSPVKAAYTGVGGIEMDIPNADKRFPDLHKLVNHAPYLATRTANPFSYNKNRAAASWCR